MTQHIYSILFLSLAMELPPAEDPRALSPSLVIMMDALFLRLLLPYYAEASPALAIMAATVLFCFSYSLNFSFFRKSNSLKYSPRYSMSIWFLAACWFDKILITLLCL